MCTGTCSSQYTGTKFYVTFLQTGQDNSLTLILYAGQTSGGTVQVSIASDSQAATGNAPFSTSVILTSYRPYRVQIPSTLQLSGSSVNQSMKAFYVNANSSITVLGYTEQVKYYSGLHSVTFNIAVDFTWQYFISTSTSTSTSIHINYYGHQLQIKQGMAKILLIFYEIA
jgi:hypothetical protein